MAEIVTLPTAIPRKRALIVEDEWLIADDIERMLLILGYDIMGPTPRSDDALALIAREAPDVGVLDISLDGHYSFPVAQELAYRDIPFIFLSGYARNDIPLAFRPAPLLQKPVSLEALTTTLSALFG